MKSSLTVRIVSLLVAAVLCLAIGGCSGSGAQMVADGRVDNLRWALDDEGCLSFTGTGAIPGVEYALSMETGLSQTIYPDWYEYRDRITEVVVGSGIDSVSMNAFMYFPALTQIDLSSTVSRIDGYAVTGCTALERITVRCPAVEMERFCIGYTGGIADAHLTEVTFAGVSGSETEKYADSCGADFTAIHD